MVIPGGLAAVLLRFSDVADCSDAQRPATATKEPGQNAANNVSGGGSNAMAAEVRAGTAAAPFLAVEANALLDRAASESSAPVMAAWWRTDRSNGKDHVAPIAAPLRTGSAEGRVRGRVSRFAEVAWWR
jgi:hypothetical protein